MERVHYARLLNPQPGSVLVDAQARSDQTLALLHRSLGERGRLVVASWDRKSLEQLQRESERFQHMEVHSTHVTNIPVKDGVANGILVREWERIVKPEAMWHEALRACTSGGRIAGVWTQWDTHLPSASQEEQSMLDLLVSPVAWTGQAWCNAALKASPHQVRDTWVDAYTLTGQNSRWLYDWKPLLREYLLRFSHVTSRDVTRLLDRLASTHGARVESSRWMVVLVKS